MSRPTAQERQRERREAYLRECGRQAELAREVRTRGEWEVIEGGGGWGGCKAPAWVALGEGLRAKWAEEREESYEAHD